MTIFVLLKKDNVPQDQTQMIGAILTVQPLFMQMQLIQTHTRLEMCIVNGVIKLPLGMANAPESPTRWGLSRHNLNELRSPIPDPAKSQRASIVK